jgi:hypothetical protein
VPVNWPGTTIHPWGAVNVEARSSSEGHDPDHGSRRGAARHPRGPPRHGCTSSRRPRPRSPPRVAGSEYRKLYNAEIEKTKVAYSGDPSLSNAGDYVRIDRPHVCIEFSCQRGIHYHTIWRDRATDYGAEFSF